MQDDLTWFVVLFITSSCDVLQLITENQDQFVQMLNEPVPDAPAPGAAAGGPVLPQFGAGQPLPGPDDAYIQITQEEKQAIDRVSLYRGVLRQFNMIHSYSYVMGL